MRITNLILAAPDLDFGIIQQRLMAEEFGPAFGKITIYTSDGDEALGLAEWLLKSLRFGRLNSRDIDTMTQEIFKRLGNVSIIKAPVSRESFGHDYFYSSPAVSSDLIKVILYQAPPGSKERPLIKDKNNFWLLKPDYLSAQQPLGLP